MVSFSPIDMLKGWGRILMTPFGIILLLVAGVYIYLRVTGRIGNLIPFVGDNDGKRKGKGGAGGSIGKQRADYILK